MEVLMLHGINPNMFGKRDPGQYGTVARDGRNDSLTALGRDRGVEVEALRAGVAAPMEAKK